jgi:hypothetical protein
VKPEKKTFDPTLTLSLDQSYIRSSEIDTFKQVVEQREYLRFLKTSDGLPFMVGFFLKRSILSRKDWTHNFSKGL